ncbi:MAG TPA: DUF3105 domain-containing protein [Nocardioides sp.]|nr:DUF3105 domain-containing protein [Nocardioides sp.]
MAKTAKSDRQAKIDQIRSKQKGAERRRGFMIVGVCVVIALIIVGAAAYRPIMNWWNLRQFEDLGLSRIGAPASVCQKVETKPATGNQDHVQPGTPIPYEDSPPAFGTHYDVWDEITRKLYTEGDRPDVGELVHNLEHGYTILWYDETIASDNEAMQTLRGIASKFTDDSNFRNKFKAVPWLESDGDPFPDGQHIAFTHWSIGGEDAQEGKQVGVWQYCSEVSGAALEEFMLEYPYTDSPEPDAI